MSKGLILLESQTATNASEISLGASNWSTSYNHYIVKWANTSFSADGTLFRMRVLVGGTAQTTAIYNQASAVISSVNVYGEHHQSYAAFTLSYNNQGNATGETASGELLLGKFNESTHYPMWFGQWVNVRDTGEVQSKFGGGSYYNAQTNNGVAFYTTSGTFSGDFELYGIFKS
jgi:hypothetical protein